MESRSRRLRDAGGTLDTRNSECRADPASERNAARSKAKKPLRTRTSATTIRGSMKLRVNHLFIYVARLFFCYSSQQW